MHNANWKLHGPRPFKTARFQKLDIRTFAPQKRWTQRLNIHPRKLTWNLKMPPWKRKNIFQTSIFGFYVNFRGCNSSITCGAYLHLAGSELLGSLNFPASQAMPSGPSQAWHHWKTEFPLTKSIQTYQHITNICLLYQLCIYTVYIYTYACVFFIWYQNYHLWCTTEWEYFLLS